VLRTSSITAMTDRTQIRRLRLPRHVRFSRPLSSSLLTTIYRELTQLERRSIHPDVAGHPHVLKMLDRVIAHINKHEGVEWVKMEDICDDFKKKNQPVKGALLPAERGLVLKDAGESILLQHDGRRSTSEQRPSWRGNDKLTAIRRSEAEDAGVKHDRCCG